MTLTAVRLALGALTWIGIGVQCMRHFGAGFPLPNFFSYFTTLLRNVDLGGLLPWINTVHHYVMPVAVVAEWLLVPPAQPPTARDLAASFAFPLVYVAYALLRGAMIGWYPYPFFNPALVGGYGHVMLYVCGIIATFIVVGLLLRWSAARRRA